MQYKYLFLIPCLTLITINAICTLYVTYTTYTTINTFNNSLPNKALETFQRLANVVNASSEILSWASEIKRNETSIINEKLNNLTNVLQNVKQIFGYVSTEASREIINKTQESLLPSDLLFRAFKSLKNDSLTNVAADALTNIIDTSLSQPYRETLNNTEY